MKRTILYNILIVALLSLASCESWLDVSPKSEIKADKLFETEAGFKDALTGLYIGMTSEDAYGANLSWQAIEFMAGQYMGGNSSFLELQKYNFEHASSKSFINKVWAKEYNIIAEANLLLESLEKNGAMLNPTLYNVIKGEALAIRAMCHFDLIRLFAKGNLANNRAVLSEPCIPYVTTYSKHITSQESYERTLELLHRDLDEALVCLKSDPLYVGTEERPDDYLDVTDDIFFTGTYYKGRETRLSWPAVMLLKARVYLWEGNRKDALTYAEDLITAIEQYVADSDKSWASGTNETDKVFKKELLFALDAQKLEDYIETAYSDRVNGQINNDQLVQSGAFVEELYVTLPTSDSRNQIWLQPVSGEDQQQNYLVVKIRETEDNSYGNYLPLMRMSEAYLIAAECLKDSDIKRAVGYMNFLKEQRNLQAAFFLPETISPEDLQLEILRDYRKEFVQEGQLFFCYKRLGIPAFMGGLNDEMTDAQYQLPYPDIENELGQRE